MRKIITAAIVALVFAPVAFAFCPEHERRVSVREGEPVVQAEEPVEVRYERPVRREVIRREVISEPVTYYETYRYDSAPAIDSYHGTKPSVHYEKFH